MYIYIGNKHGTKFIGSDNPVEYNLNPNKNLIDAASEKKRISKSEEDIIEYTMLVNPLSYTSDITRAYPFVKDNRLALYLKGLDQKGLKLEFDPVIYYMDYFAISSNNLIPILYERSIEQIFENYNKAIEEEN